MFNIEIKRRVMTPTYTIGDLFINGDKFCNTLEDTVRRTTDPKVWGKTAIPAGKYKVDFLFSPHFARKMPTLLNVPNFSHILIHYGNTAKDTDGCILVGLNTAPGEISDSRITFGKLFSQMYDAYNALQEIWLSIE